MADFCSAPMAGCYAAVDTLDGGDGNDILNGGDGNDEIDGGDGFDTLTIAGENSSDIEIDLEDGTMTGGGLGNDDLISIEAVEGGRYRDEISGNNAANLFSGNAGNDLLRGRAGNDTLLGGSGDDYIYGNDDNDLLRGGTGDDVLRGGTGNDTLYGGDGDDDLRGGEGNDLLLIELGQDTIRGEEGDDAFVLVEIGHNEVVNLYGGTGHDLLDVSAFEDGITLSDDSIFEIGRIDFDDLDIESLIATDFRDLLYLDGAFEEIYAGGGDDYINLTASGYSIDGGTGYDLVEIDGIVGSNISASMIDGILTIDWGLGSTTITNVESFRFDDGYYTAEMLATSAPWEVQYHEGTSGDNNIRGTVADDHIEMGGGDDTATAGLGNDTVLGGAGDDDVFANDGNDWIEGNDGNDALNGGAGDDTIIGGSGNDSLIGAGGSDTFVFSENSGSDYIFGWDSSDLLDFSSLTATAGLLSIDAPEFGFDQISCFNPNATENVNFTIRQVDNDTYIYLGTEKEIADMEPTVILLSTDASSITIDDFIFS